MIPKKIHYCWFGNQPLPESVQKCIDSWIKFCPDYEIIRWDETNYDVKKNPYIAEAYDSGKYAFVSDYARLDIIYEYGGVYLDTDVELLRNLDSLLGYEAFFGLEMPGRIATGLGFGAKKGHGIIKENKIIYESISFFANGKYNGKTCIDYTMEVFDKYNKFSTDRIYLFDDFIVLPTEYLCPINIESGKRKITNNTISIHHYDASWYSNNKISKVLKKKLIPFKIKIRKIVDKFFGKGTYEIIKRKIR
ncbi:glycosyltransferase family 32 protein [Enterococcus casseliflavus]|uniref:glycosyltransferase family 32 protein n=1 Tax=Enterococcus casseliflavus TaxID=37734 RepID=UPI0039A6D35D